MVEFRLKLLYQFSETCLTIIKCVWLWIARMRMVETYGKIACSN